MDLQATIDAIEKLDDGFKDFATGSKYLSLPDKFRGKLKNGKEFFVKKSSKEYIQKELKALTDQLSQTTPRKALDRTDFGSGGYATLLQAKVKVLEHSHQSERGGAKNENIGKTVIAKDDSEVKTIDELAKESAFKIVVSHVLDLSDSFDKGSSSADSEVDKPSGEYGHRNNLLDETLTKIDSGTAHEEREGSLGRPKQQVLWTTIRTTSPDKKK